VQQIMQKMQTLTLVLLVRLFAGALINSPFWFKLCI
jgi:hypothetical protein